METIGFIQKKIDELGSKIAAPKNLLILPTSPVGDGTPHIEITNDTYEYVYVERYEIARKKTADLDEFLYWFFDDVTSSMSWDYELKHRVENQDFRRIAFQKKLSLMTTLCPNWAEKTHRELMSVLRNNPYQD